MSNDISKVDKNFAVVANIFDGKTDFYDVREAPFKVYGLYDYKNQPQFKRLPDEIAKSVNEGVAVLYLHTAGGRVRFCTDSEFVAIRAELGNVSRFSHMPATGTMGFDLYVDNIVDGSSRFVKSFIPPYDTKDSFEGKISLGFKKKRYFTINFPSYSGVVKLYVGVSKGSAIGEGMSYENELPLVYYGSSITQGGCSSRPGNIYQNVICQRTNLDYVNLGFSGSGKAEDEIVDYMASMPMSAFICDYDHNAPNAEHLAATHCKMYKKIRQAHPDIPYIMISRCDFDYDYNQNILRRDVIIDTYRYAREQGDTNVYYIDGASVFRGPYKSMCTVDSVHPNDLGFALMADAIGAELKRAFTQSDFTE